MSPCVLCRAPQILLGAFCDACLKLWLASPEYGRVDPETRVPRNYSMLADFITRVRAETSNGGEP